MRLAVRGALDGLRGSLRPDERGGMQSTWLVWLVGWSLTVNLGLRIFLVVGMAGPPAWFVEAAGLSAGFALLVWMLRAATAPGAALGGVICLRMLMKMDVSGGWGRTALPELVALFAMTFVATRFGRARKERSGLAEGRSGRRAAQVVANLGMAGLWAAQADANIFVGALAALAEAAADTVSSEMGQALGGRTLLITTGRRVEAGVDGGVSLAGTACGVAAAGVIAGLAVALGAVGVVPGWVIFGVGCAGLLFDSVLGATVERRGWLGNDAVNFTSTWAAAWLAFEANRVLTPPAAFW